MPNISFQNVKKVFPDGTYALDGVSFEIRQGEFVCIMGESGGGKTTLLKLISGIETATCGEIYFDNKISNLLKTQERDVAFVFQEYTIYPHMTVFENIVFSLQKEKISYEEKCEKAYEIIKKMGLELIQGEVPKHLSFGQCQKVALARALVRKPKIILFDEPLSNIDATSKEEFKKLILEAKRILPESTFIYVTHNGDDALKLADKIMVIDKGKIIQFDSKRIVFEYPSTKLVLDYLVDMKEEYVGKIENNKFISPEFSKELNAFELKTLNEDTSNITCCHTSRHDYYFNQLGELLFGIKDKYLIDVKYQDDELLMLDKHVKLESIKRAIINYDFKKVILYRNSFEFEEKEESIEFDGIVDFVSKDYLVVKINELIVAFENQTNLKINDPIKLYYPIKKLRGLDTDGNFNISSYYLSDNICICEIENKEKGIVKLGKVKFKVNIDPKYKRQVEIKIPLDGFVLNKKGKFRCDIIHNEEDLGNKTLIHFATNNINEYLSLTVNENIKGYKKELLKYDINLDKIVVVNGR